MATQTADAKPVRYRDPQEIVDSIRRQVRGLENRAAVEDPWVMAEMVAIQAEMDAAVIRTVRRLREAGYTWTDIGFSLKISGDTAQKRYGSKIR